MQQNFNGSGKTRQQGYLNGDGKVDFQDFYIFRDAFNAEHPGQSCP
jgi:hypothetical protein